MSAVEINDGSYILGVRLLMSPAGPSASLGDISYSGIMADRRLAFGSGLLRLVAVVEGEQRLPGRAEMFATEAVERTRPLRCEQRWRRERLHILIVMITPRTIVVIAARIEVRPVRQRGARRPEADQCRKIIPAAAVRIAGPDEI